MSHTDLTVYFPYNAKIYIGKHMTSLSPASRDRTGTHIPAPDFEAGVSTKFHHSGIIVGTEGFEPITYIRTLRPERSAATSYATCR